MTVAGAIDAAHRGMTGREREQSAMRCLWFADWLRGWRLAARLSEQQAARRLRLVSMSWIIAAERAHFDPMAVPPAILERIRAQAGPPPPVLQDIIEPPQGAGAAGRAGCPDDGGGRVASPERRPPPPEGPDGPDRAGDDDDDHEPAFPHVMIRPEFGQVMIETVFGCGSTKIFTPDEALRLAVRLIDGARQARGQD